MDQISFLIAVFKYTEPLSFLRAVFKYTEPLSFLRAVFKYTEPLSHSLTVHVSETYVTAVLKGKVRPRTGHDGPKGE